MKNIIKESHKKTGIYIIILILFCFNTAKAQPGWRDFTARYAYRILDENQKEISFKTDKDYRIMINNMLYTSPEIPQEKLKTASRSDNGFQKQIHINDFSSSIPQENNNLGDNRLQIKIIYKKDTMFIMQPTGKGSFGNEILKNGTDAELTFIPGYYYFPGWTKQILDNIPKTSGNVKIANISQRHFIIPEKMYTSLFYTNHKDDLFSKADKLIADNFMKEYFSVQKTIETTQFDQSVEPYSDPYFNSALFPTKDPDRVFSMIGFSSSQSNCTSYKNFFSILNKKQNTIKLFFPKKNPRLFGSEALYADSFNHILYLPVWTKKEFNNNLSDCQNQLPAEYQMYSSKDEGKTWQENNPVKKLFKHYDFRKIEFLDKNHALAYSKKSLKQKVKNSEIVQGTYYLLKNMQVTDSLKTPNDLYYDSNNNNYRFSVEGDTILLGSWTYDEEYNIGKTKYTQPFLKKSGDTWKFQVKEKMYDRSVPKIIKKEDLVQEYQNFHLINKRELIFKNGSGSLKLSSDIQDHELGNGYLVLEKDQQIYLIDRHSVYLSHDGGTTWFLYPLPLEQQNGSYHFLEIDDQNKLSFFSNEFTEEGKKIRKIFHKFTVEK